MVTIAVYAVVCGANDFVAIAVWERTKHAQAEQIPERNLMDEKLRSHYLDLIESCLLNLIYEDPWTDWTGRVPRAIARCWASCDSCGMAI